MNLSTISIDQDEAIEQLGRYRQAVKDHPDDTLYRSVERGLRWLARTEVACCACGGAAMTDRAKALLVHLSDDLRLGDEVTGADRVIAAIAMIKGVVKVEPMLANFEDVIARQRVVTEFKDRLWAVLEEGGRS